MSAEVQIPVVVGLVTLIDPREEFYTNFLETKGMDLREQYGFNHSSALELLAGEKVVDAGMIDRQDEVYRAARELSAAGADMVMLNLPGWTPPGWGGIIHTLARLPMLIYAPFALSGPLAMRGELAALGADSKASFGEEEPVREFIDQVRAKKLLAALRGVKVGRIGGFSMGMHYAEPGPAAALRDFGLEIEPVDGSRILTEAELLDRGRVDQFVKELSRAAAAFPAVPSLQSVLEKQVRYYLVLKDLAERERFDFVTVQCQPEFSDIHGALCLAVSFLPSPADCEGEKKVTPVSCEGDFYAALAGYLLYKLSGQPPFFGDLIMPFFDDNTLAVQNCGGACTWHAARSADNAENLACVSVVKNLQGKSGSCALDYLAPAAPSATLLGIGPRERGCWMTAERVELLEREDLKPLLMEWPTLFIRSSDARDLLRRMYSQHIALVPGDYAAILERCRELLEGGVLNG